MLFPPLSLAVLVIELKLYKIIPPPPKKRKKKSGKKAPSLLMSIKMRTNLNQPGAFLLQH